MTTREQFLSALESFASQKPGMEPGNYGSYNDYRNESAQVTRDLHHFRELLTAVSWRESITVEQMIEAARSNGRLTWDVQKERFDYCTGQYFPTEFRRAACRFLSGLLWDYWRETATPTKPTPEGRIVSGDDIRTKARHELSRAIANRYFR